MRKLTGLLLTLGVASFQMLADDATAPATTPTAAPAEPPTSWIDPDTGHRVIRLTREPGSDSFYFNYNGYTPDGKKMAYTTPNGISVLNLETLEAKQLVTGPAKTIIVAHATPNLYYTRAGDKPQFSQLWCVNLDTGENRKLADLPRRASVVTVNADETLLAGTILQRTDWGTNTLLDGGPNRRTDLASQDASRGKKGLMMEERLGRRYPMELFFYDLKTGRTRRVNRTTDWLNHLQFSPTDPHLLMFCHEGAWQKVDRIWTIRTDGSHPQLIQPRTMLMEIAGHEFWSADGQTVWYDLQTPRGEDFWVGGCEITTGERTWYHLQRDEWSVHFNVSPDGRWFCGDGGDDQMVAHAPHGKWLYLFTPELVADRSDGYIDTRHLVKPGVFHSERLVNMARHDYALEPNAMFSPDMKWLIFRSNMSGASQVYAVELKPASKP